MSYLKQFLIVKVIKSHLRSLEIISVNIFLRKIDHLLGVQPKIGDLNQKWRQGPPPSSNRTFPPSSFKIYENKISIKRKLFSNYFLLWNLYIFSASYTLIVLLNLNLTLNILERQDEYILFSSSTMCPGWSILSPRS